MTRKQVERKSLSLEDAQNKGLCRICGRAFGTVTPANPIILNFGHECAHRKCLAKIYGATQKSRKDGLALTENEIAHLMDVILYEDIGKLHPDGKWTYPKSIRIKLCKIKTRFVREAKGGKGK